MEEGNPHILVVEDEPVTCDRMAAYFEAEGYRVSKANSGEQMREIIQSRPIDLVLLDIRLPGDDGLVLARELRSQSDIGIILVTGRTDDIDRIIGLEIGADDYVTKPVNLRELLARVKNLLRRCLAPSLDTASLPTFSFENWTLDLPRRQLCSPTGDTVALTRAEFELLSTFVTHAQVVLSRDRLLGRLPHRAYSPDNRTIDVLVGRLRRKIETDPHNPVLISTVHGEGYVFTADVTIARAVHRTHQAGAL